MESHKLDLMAEVAELRLRLQTVDNERTDYKDRYEGLQVSNESISVSILSPLFTVFRFRDDTKVI